MRLQVFVAKNENLENVIRAKHFHRGLDMSKTQFSGFTEPKFIIDRREKLRLEALAEGKRALEAIRENGGNAVIFGSVLRPGESRKIQTLIFAF